MWRLKLLPRPLRPMIRKSLNFATFCFITAVLFLNSPQKFSSLPTLKLTTVPSSISLRAITLKAIGKVLLLLQCVGRAVQRTLGAPVLTSSPGCSLRISVTCLSAHHHSGGYIELDFSSDVLHVSLVGPETIVAMRNRHVIAKQTRVLFVYLLNKSLYKRIVAIQTRM